MDWRSVKFCPSLAAKKSGDGKLSYDSVAAILASNLFAGCTKAKELLCARYRQMVGNYLGVPHDDPKWDLKIGSTTFKCEGEDDAALLQIPGNAMPGCQSLVTQLWDHLNFGHDMPTWMVKCGIKDPKRVMIVSQDPLRKNHKAGTLVLSTPFGFHSADYRDIKCENAVLFRLVERLIEDCRVCVYLTDCRKLFTDDVLEGSRGRANFVRSHQRQYRKMFKSLLEAELAAFAPELVIALGNDAAEYIGAEPPRKGYYIQDVGGRGVVAAYHTGAFASVLKRFIPSGSTQDYFDAVFTEVSNHL